MTEEEKAKLDELPRWGLEEKPMDEVTLKDLEGLCDAAFARERNIEALSMQVDAETEARNAILERVRKYITHFGKNNYESSSGLVELRTRTSYRTPKTPEEKKAFFEWLQSKGVFWEYASVNSNSLNSLCKQEAEIAKESGIEFQVPGIGAPSDFVTIHLRKKK